MNRSYAPVHSWSLPNRNFSLPFTCPTTSDRFDGRKGCVKTFATPGEAAIGRGSSGGPSSSWRDDWGDGTEEKRKKTPEGRIGGSGSGRGGRSNGFTSRGGRGAHRMGDGSGRRSGRESGADAGTSSSPPFSHAEPSSSATANSSSDAQGGTVSSAPDGTGIAAASRSRAVAPSKPDPLPVVRERDSDKGTFFHKSTSFKGIGASPEVIAALSALGITRPSHVQAEAYQLLLDSRLQHIAIMDQAGSGKTLAYLLPMLQLLRQEERKTAAAAAVEDSGDKTGKPQFLARPGAPRLIVAAPTIELVQQVYRVAKALSASGLRFRSACMTGGQEDKDRRGKSWRTQVSQLEAGLDLLVATPGRLQEHVQAGNLKFDACKAIVLDEVDVLLGDKAEFQSQIDSLREAAPPSLRFVLVTATLPQHTLALVREGFPDISLAMGPGLHRTATGLEEELVDCSGGEEITLEAGTQRKLDALTQVLSRRAAPRVLVFCNKIDTCRIVENHLSRSDRQGSKFKVLAYHEAIRDEVRSANLDTFLRPVRRRSGAAAGEADAEVPIVMVATDRMSRGIDCMYCEHVVMFDFPRDPSEYVRRAGRTARGAGGRGTVSVLVLGRQVPLAKEIMAGNEKGQPIHKLPETE